MWIHLVARTRFGFKPCLQEEICRWLWKRIQNAFPSACSAVLMPDHLHILTFTENPRADRLTLARLIGRLTHLKAWEPGSWAPTPPPTLIPDRFHLQRQVRYVALNPCRKGLCRDPLEWTWSTHQDVCGAVADPWVSADRLASALGHSPTHFAERHHAYVSSDPSVRSSGTPFPRAAPLREIPSVPLETIARAAALATRSPVERIRSRSFARRLFVAAAHRQGWKDRGLIARCTSVRADSVRESALDAIPGPALHAVLLRLGDSRLGAYTHQSKGCGNTPPRG